MNIFYFLSIFFYLEKKLGNFTKFEGHNHKSFGNDLTSELLQEKYYIENPLS